jgi:hypothetical protein
MKGICKTDNALYVGQFYDGTTIRIGLNSRQRWTFKTRGDGNVMLEYRNITICMTREQFLKEDWEIIEKAEG